MPTHARSFPATGKGARSARLFASEVLHTSEGLAERVALVVSELAANVVVHAHTPFTVSVQQDGAAVRIEVEDGDPSLPQMEDHGRAAPTGRGLRVVDQLTDAWGVRPTDGGKVVWVEFHPVERAGGTELVEVRILDLPVDHRPLRS